MLSDDEVDILKGTNKLLEQEIGRLKCALNTKDSVVYIGTQWGNNVIIPQGNVTVITNTQWGSNMRLYSTAFTSDPDKLVEKIIKRLGSEGSTPRKMAKEQDWNVVEVGPEDESL